MRPPWLNTSACHAQLPVMVQSKNMPDTFSALPWMARASAATPSQVSASAPGRRRRGAPGRR
jgi:hypothetical protein